MQRLSRLPGVAFIVICSGVFAGVARAQQTTATPATTRAPEVAEWIDNFDGAQLDAGRWEPFSFEGAGGGKNKIEEGQLRLRGLGGARFGVRSRQSFAGERFIVEATVAKVGAALPEPNRKGTATGNAVLNVMFDSSGRNRIEWLLTSEGAFEAWAVVDGKAERLDDRKLATMIKSPTLGIVRLGDEFLFMLNGQEGLRRNIRNMPRNFRVMLYGFGSSENNWDSVRVVTTK
jgi:hypothetical protein